MIATVFAGNARATARERILSLQLGCTNADRVEGLRNGNFVVES